MVIINASETERIKTPVGYLVVDVRDRDTVLVWMERLDGINLVTEMGGESFGECVPVMYRAVPRPPAPHDEVTFGGRTFEVMGVSYNGDDIRIQDELGQWHTWR